MSGRLLTGTIRLTNSLRAGNARMQFVRFVTANAVDTALYGVLLFLLNPFGSHLANVAGALASSALANELHRRLTFRAGARVTWLRAQWEGCEPGPCRARRDVGLPRPVRRGGRRRRPPWPTSPWLPSSPVPSVSFASPRCVGSSLSVVAGPRRRQQPVSEPAASAWPPQAFDHPAQLPGVGPLRTSGRRQ